jgi:arylsulfatase A-like enzyme
MICFPQILCFGECIHVQKLENKLNVILISVDTLRADHLHFMGYRRETSPNMDELALHGVFLPIL